MQYNQYKNVRYRAIEWIIEVKYSAINVALCDLFCKASLLQSEVFRTIYQQMWCRGQFWVLKQNVFNPALFLPRYLLIHKISSPLDLTATDYFRSSLPTSGKRRGGMVALSQLDTFFGIEKTKNMGN